MKNSKVIESRKEEFASISRAGSENVVYVDDQNYDEINLGELIDRLADEWKVISLVMLVGLTLSVAASFYLSRVYQVEAIVRLPNVNELGSIRDQTILDITPGLALARFVTQLMEPANQLEVFKKSALFQMLSKDSELTSPQIFSDIRNNMSVSRVSHNYYQLAKTEKTPLKEIKLSLESSAPKLAAEYFHALIDHAHATAVTRLLSDILTIKQNRIQTLKDKLKSLTLAADASRNAEIRRLEEINTESIAGFRMQIALLVRKAKADRENLIIRVEEALATARALNIVDPVTWDDLRSNRNKSQITNEFGGKDHTAPRYFQGTRILTAELNRLRSRSDDKPFIEGLADLEKQISELENDPKIAALKGRQDDTIYLSKYDELQQELSRLAQTPENFKNVKLALVTQEAVISPNPTRNPMLIILLGVFISAITSLFFALIWSSIRNKNSGN